MKKDNWLTEMHSAIAKHDKPFVYGENDCCLMCADTVLAMTGFDHMAGLRGKYKSAAGGAVLLRRKGYKTLFDYLTDCFGPASPASFARRGDVVFENEGIAGPRIGICVGALSAFVGSSPEHEGVVYQKTLESKWCFRG